MRHAGLYVYCWEDLHPLCDVGAELVYEGACTAAEGKE